MCCGVLGICRSIWNKFRFDLCGECSTKTRASDFGQGLFYCVIHQPTSERGGTGHEQHGHAAGGATAGDAQSCTPVLRESEQQKNGSAEAEP